MTQQPPQGPWQAAWPPPPHQRPPARSHRGALIALAVMLPLALVFAVTMVVISLNRPSGPRMVVASPASPRSAGPMTPLEEPDPSPSTSRPAQPAASRVTLPHLTFTLPADYRIRGQQISKAYDGRVFTGGDELVGYYLRDTHKAGGPPSQERLRTEVRRYSNLSQKNRREAVAMGPLKCTGDVVWLKQPTASRIHGMDAIRWTFRCPSERGTDRGEIVTLEDSHGWFHLFMVRSSALDYVREQATINDMLTSARAR